MPKLYSPRSTRVQGEIQIGFIIDTLKYLAASGRAPAVQAFVGNLLNIKPMLQIVDGSIEVADRVRGRKRSKRMVLDMIANWAEGRPIRFAIANANVPDEAQELAETAREQMNVKELAIVELGPVLGALVGPGTIALGAYPVDQDNA